MKPVTGQYECVHSTGVGLEYFTARIDTLTLYADGRFLLKIQQHSRVRQAAQSLIQGQQPTTNVPERQQEGTYQLQGMELSFSFAGGGFEHGAIDADEAGLMLGPNHFTKVSDSTMLPPTHRMQQNMDDIAKGLKIAGTIGSFAMKAVKTVQSTIQTTQGSQQDQNPQQPTARASTYEGNANSYNDVRAQQAPGQSGQGNNQTPNRQQPAQPLQTAPGLYCDQCGARLRPGKRFCNNCGARVSDS